MAKYSDAELVEGLRRQILQADSWSGGVLAENMEKSLDYYYGRPRGDELDGCSSVISMDVADMVEAVVAGMMPAFDGGNVIEFEAESREDEQAARAELAACSWVIFSKNDGYNLVQQSVRDALLLRNGWLKCYKHRMVDTVTNSYTIQTELVPFLLADPNRTELSREEIEGGMTRIRVRDTIDHSYLRICSVDPTNMYFTPGWDQIDVHEIPFLAERHVYTRSQLVEMGYPASKVADCKTMGVDDNMAAQKRPGAQNMSPSQEFEPAQDWIECFECYWRIDVDGDGIAELRRMFLASNVLLADEDYEFIPFSTGSPFLQSHNLTGLSLYDKLKQVQDVKTGALRQYLDCFTTGNLGRVGFLSGMVNTDHLLNPRPGGAVEIHAPDAIVPIPTIDVGPSAQLLLQYMDTVRSARGGASLDLQTAEAQIVGETAQGIERQYSVREQLAAMMARTLVSTMVAGMYKNVHRALRTYMDGPLKYRTKEDYAETDPSQWPERTRVVVRGGLSAGEQRRKQGALATIIGQQQLLLRNGMNGILVNLGQLYGAQIDWARASGIDNPEAYFINPESQESMQAQQQQAQQAQQQQQLQQQFAAMTMQLEQQKLAFEKYKTDSELRWKYYDSQLDADVREAQITADNVTRIQVEGIKKLQHHDDYEQGDGQGDKAQAGSAAGE